MASMSFCIVPVIKCKGESDRSTEGHIRATWSASPTETGNPIKTARGFGKGDRGLVMVNQLIDRPRFVLDEVRGNIYRD